MKRTIAGLAILLFACNSIAKTSWFLAMRDLDDSTYWFDLSSVTGTADTKMAWVMHTRGGQVDKDHIHDPRYHLSQIIVDCHDYNHHTIGVRRDYDDVGNMLSEVRSDQTLSAAPDMSMRPIALRELNGAICKVGTPVKELHGGNPEPPIDDRFKGIRYLFCDNKEIHVPPGFPSGSTTISFTVVADKSPSTPGKIGDVAVVKSSGDDGLDQAISKELATRFRCYPYLKDGVPVKAKTQITITYTDTLPRPIGAVVPMRPGPPPTLDQMYGHQR